MPLRPFAITSLEPPYYVYIYLIDKFQCQVLQVLLKAQNDLVLFVASHLQVEVTNTEKIINLHYIVVFRDAQISVFLFIG